jgi:hypothetical protein
VLVTSIRDELLIVALAAANRGWHVFPLRHDDKRPAITDWPVLATTDVGNVASYWTAGTYNVGIACGPSRLVVVDLDVAKPGDAAPPNWAHRDISHGQQVLDILAAEAQQPKPVRTFTVSTGSGGTHLYFTAPDGEPLRNSAGRLGWLVDTRANGGYVVAAGSVVAGRPYRVIDWTPPAPLPDWIAAALRPATARTPALSLATVSQRSRYAAAALRNELDRVLGAEPGTRNHTLNAAAYSLGQLVATGLLPEQFTSAALHRAGAAIGLGDREIATTVRSGLSAGAKHPRALTP